MRSNEPRNRALENIAGEVPSVGAALGTVSEHRSMKDQFNTFQYKVNQYVLHELYNPSDIIIVIRDLKDPYAHVAMDNTSKISK